jgi:hypothetical protein
MSVLAIGKTLNEFRGPNADREAVDLVRDLVRESSRDRKDTKIVGGWNIEQWWQFGSRRWVGDHHDVEPRRGLVGLGLRGYGDRPGLHES